MIAMTRLEQPRAASLPTASPWLIAVVMTVPRFMEVLDTSIANVALRYIASGLSAAETDSEWIITSDLAANAVKAPRFRIPRIISGILSEHPGRERRSNQWEARRENTT
jgi:DHA2 family multidrug resistance protein